MRSTTKHGRTRFTPRDRVTRGRTFADSRGVEYDLMLDGSIRRRGIDRQRNNLRLERWPMTGKRARRERIMIRRLVRAHADLTE